MSTSIAVRFVDDQFNVASTPGGLLRVTSADAGGILACLNALASIRRHNAAGFAALAAAAATAFTAEGGATADQLMADFGYSPT